MEFRLSRHDLVDPARRDAEPPGERGLAEIARDHPLVQQDLSRARR
jgi:hypothetical protein